MILVDTSVWADHFRVENRDLIEVLGAGLVLSHPFIVGEVALGSLRKRKLVIGDMAELPTAVVATNDEVEDLIERCELFGRGVGYVDVHLLASVRLTAGSTLATFDRRMLEAAKVLGLRIYPLTRSVRF